MLYSVIVIMCVHGRLDPHMHVDRGASLACPLPLSLPGLSLLVDDHAVAQGRGMERPSRIIASPPGDRLLLVVTSI